jgi:hypothetical protein
MYMKRSLIFILTITLLIACAPTKQITPTAAAISATQSTAESGTATATATATSVASATPQATNTPEPTATLSSADNSKYMGLDVEHPLETCPVITDIKAYWEWLQNSPIEPFGPNAVLRPLTIYGDAPPYHIVQFDPRTDKDYKDPSTWSFRQSPNIVCYNSGQLQYLLLPTAWLNPNDRSKPIWTLTGQIYHYSFGIKPTDEHITKNIKAWLSGKPSFAFPAVDFGGSFGIGNENDFLETQTAINHPNIKDLTYQFFNTGDASSVSAPDIILEASITLHN